MSTTTRQNVIASLVAMFNAEHGNTEAPAWLLELHHRSTDAQLTASLANWRANYPAHYTQHGLYVM